MKGFKNLRVFSLVLMIGILLVGCGTKKEVVSEVTTSAAVTTAAATTESSTTDSTPVDSTKDPITGETYPNVINIGIIEGGPESAILIQENLFANFPVKVNAVNYAAGTAINNAVVSGDVDVSSFGSSPIALGIAKDINYKVVFIPYNQGGNIEALAVKNTLVITQVADLKGKNIAAPFGTTSHYALLNALELGGLKASDVTLYDMGGQDIVAAWTRGDIDAAYIWSPALDELVKDGTIITNDGKLAEQGVIIPEIAVARNEFAEKYPTLVGLYVQALIEVYNFSQTNKEGAIQDVADWEGASIENATSQINDNIWVSAQDQLSADYLGTSTAKGALAQTLKTIADFHAAQGNISTSPDLSVFENAIDPSYVEAALK